MPPLQFGNTCYLNSVVQALYYCEPFRRRVLAGHRDAKAAHKASHKAGKRASAKAGGGHRTDSGLSGGGAGHVNGGGAGSKGPDGNLLLLLGELFTDIETNKRKYGVVAPKKLFLHIRRVNCKRSRIDVWADNRCWLGG